MPSWLPSLPYRPQEMGYWSPVTSTINWCEEDYYATPYSAEIVNTLTNLFFMSLAFKGMYSCWKHGHDRVFFLTFFGYLCVGFGSFCFHATLLYPWQLVDELSMIYTTCIMCHATFSFRRSTTFHVLMGIFLVALALFITLYYHFLQDPTFHQTAYGVLTAVVLLRSMYVMEVSIRPSLRAKQSEVRKLESEGQNGFASPADKAEQLRCDRSDIETLKTMWKMVGYGLFVFLLGFLIWNLDNAYCGKVRGWRREVGLPWGIVLEGHGWWHMMTGTGAYFYIVWGVWLRHCLKGEQDQYEVRWPRLVTSLPICVRKEEQPPASKSARAAVHMNGKKTK